MTINIQKAFDVVKEYYSGDINKTMQWFRGSVVDFYGATPLQMIHKGQEKKVLAYVQKNFVRR